MASAQKECSWLCIFNMHGPYVDKQDGTRGKMGAQGPDNEDHANHAFIFEFRPKSNNNQWIDFNFNK